MPDIKDDILEYLLGIPKWKVMTYKTLADVFGVHPRKVAMTMKYNSVPDVFPCYKIIAHDGRVSGYNGIGWVEEKNRRLNDDGVQVIEGRIPKKFII